jgi:CNH domain
VTAEDCKTSTSEFDFTWNTSPTSIVCAFPYVIAFTADSMEIRLLVNGNLVHTVSMADLQLITSKRDIYFATTAPEFIQKGSKIKGLDAEEHELSSENCSPRTKVEDYSGNVFSDSDEAPNSGVHSQNSLEDGVVKSSDNLCVNITLSCDDGNPPIQRARSLQSTNSSTTAPENSLSPMSEAKRSIAKSNSCGESYTNQAGGQTELHVPPNSPKLVVTLDTTPSKKMSLTSRHLKTASANNELDSPKSATKPLRIYRIPIANLMGTNVHAHHYHYPIDDHKKISKLQTPSESAEDTTGSVDNDDDDIFSVPTKPHLDDDDEESLLNTNNIFDQIKAQIMELNLKAGDIGTTVQSVANSLPVVVGVKPKNLSTSSSSTSSSCTNSSTVTSL